MEVVEENSNNNKSRKGGGATLLHTSIAKLSGSSRIIPSHKDFHFYNNFDEFKNPLKQIDHKSKHLLNKIGASEYLLRNPIEFPEDRDVELDDDVVVDWLVDVNDEIFESIDMSLDEFKTVRKQEEESGVRVEHDDGFQVVGKKKKNNNKVSLSKNAVEEKMEGVQEVKVATKVKPRIPFHVASIPKPQDEYKIIVNNANQPFEHVWLQRSEDGSRFIHPLENLAVHDFVDKSESLDEPQQPPPIELTPFHFVQDVKDLKQLAIKLRGVNEFAVDLEHNQYRSFQGLTCLMQISTRTEDFVIDTLKLRVHIGPHLRELFKDPAKRKVMHGANSDIVWLQRDFGIYVCNMFDTGQASRVLKMERHSLEYLLNHFCGVAANKEYQNADWRLRPLPEEMIKYAREDTHYLLYIHDLMKTQLLMLPAESDSSDPPLVEVYKRSYDLCTHLYEKELLTENSYLHIYGLHGAELNAQQLAIVSGLCDWRDVVARAEDESTGYVLPNRTLIEIAKHMPLTTSNLRKVLKTKHPYIERNLGSVVSVIRQSIQNAAGFEEAAENLKKKHLEMLDHLMQASEEKALGAKKSEELLPEAPELLKNAEEVGSSMQYDDQLHKVEGSNAKVATHDPDLSFRSSLRNGHEKTGEVMIQVLKKPNRAFGALLGSSAKRKFDPDKREETKLEHIKSTVTLPFHKFLGRDDHLLPDGKETAKKLEVSPDGKETFKKLEVSPSGDTSAPATGSTLDDIIVLDNESDAEESAKDESEATSNNQLNQTEKDDEEMDEGDEPMSLSDLSSSFQKCLTPAGQSKSSKGANKSKQSGDLLQVEPFDYETARKEVQFGKGSQRGATAESGGNNRSKQNKGKKGTTSESGGCEGTSDLLPQGRRRQAFPASGNRTATFR